MNINTILSMGGYGIYVWSAYALMLAVFSLNLFFIFKEKKQVKKAIKHYLLQSQRT